MYRESFTGNLRLELHPLNFAPIVEAAVDALRPTAGAKSIQLQVEFATAVRFWLEAMRIVFARSFGICFQTRSSFRRAAAARINLDCVESMVRLKVSDHG